MRGAKGVIGRGLLLALALQGGSNVAQNIGDPMLPVQWAMTAAQAAYVVAGAVAALGWPRPTAARRALLWAWATTLTLAVALIPPAWVTDWTALDVAKAAGIAAGVGALVVWLLWGEPAQGPPTG